MSFQKIIDAMDSLYFKHQQINKRFSSKFSSAHFYRNCLRED